MFLSVNKQRVERPAGTVQNMETSWICVSSLGRNYANPLYVILILVYVLLKQALKFILTRKEHHGGF